MSEPRALEAFCEAVIAEQGANSHEWLVRHAREFLAARPPASPPALEALLAKWCACRDDDTFESWHERDAFAKQIREALAVPPEAPPP
jgi:hypothetical protein